VSVQVGKERKKAMQEKPVLLTQEGLEKLRAELSHLVNERRPEIAQRIKMAKEFGDLTENAEYDDAKNEQGFVEGRILTVEQMIRNASLIETDEHTDGSVQLGSSVKVKDDFGEMTYTIVGPAEADAGSGRISLESPVGKALLGGRPGDEISVETPGGPRQVQILKVA
jgi:transcription elongation factor GreA